jgi:acyl-CoA reductase-like NAD-dependent aldehyde dehydrogenase
VIARYPDVFTPALTAADVRAAMDAAAAAFPAWSARTAYQRGAILERAASLLEDFWAQVDAVLREKGILP